ncbi:MAG: DUF1559 domain-containing protein [Thermoguttaceae bacterium]|jgi:hypothetical protein|nr:DUF1559 domain-containing protein [Thermoguttaceae bacterium]
MSENQPAPEDAAHDAPEQDRRNRRRLWFCGAVVAVLVAMAMYVNLSHSRPLRISRETTYITEPLKSDGKRVDYFAAIRLATRPDNAATDENGYWLLVRHLGAGPDTAPRQFALICEELGLDPSSVRHDMQYQEPFAFLDSYAKSARFDEALLDALRLDEQSRDEAAWKLDQWLHHPWTLEELPMMAEWLEQNSPALDLVGRAVRKPTFYIPLLRQNEEESLLAVPLPELQRMRSFARGLAARANHRIAVGDIDGAIDDIIACKRLGRRVGHGPFLVDLLVGLAFEGIADAIGIAGSLEHPPTKEQLERLLAETDALPRAADAEDAMPSERYFALDFIQSMAHGKGSWDDLGLLNGPSTGILSRLSTDWNVVARRYNELFDEIMATGNPPPNAAITPGTAVRLISIRARSEHWGNVLASMLHPSWDAVHGAARRRDCIAQMQRITLAMLLYERDHGTLPPAWSADAAAKALHSWRVLLLPYLGHQDLYERIRLDEPWESEHNRQFHGEAMDVYRCPADPAAGPGQTTYSVVVGHDMPFDAGEGKRLADFGPHSNDMILLVERTDPINWMAPTREVLQAAAERGICDGTDPGRIGSHHHPGVANLGFRDGAVHSIQNVIHQGLFVKLLRGTNADKTVEY